MISKLSQFNQQAPSIKSVPSRSLIQMLSEIHKAIIILYAVIKWQKSWPQVIA